MGLRSFWFSMEKFPKSALVHLLFLLRKCQQEEKKLQKQMLVQLNDRKVGEEETQKTKNFKKKKRSRKTIKNDGWKQRLENGESGHKFTKPKNWKKIA